MKRLILLLALVGCGAPPANAPVIRPVRTMVPRSVTGELARTFRGTVHPSDSAALAFKVGGRIRAMHVEVGDVVVAGAPLAELEDTELRLQQSQADAALAQARAAARVARSTLERVQALYVNNNASPSEVEGARANADATAAQVVAAARQRDLAAQQVADAKLLASRDGTVATVRANPGELVGAGTPVVLLTSGDQLEVSMGVPGSLIARVTRGMAVKVRETSESGRVYSGTITEVGVTSTGATFPVTVVFEEQTPDLRAGLAVEVDLVFPPLEDNDRLVIPLSAIGEDDAGTFVWTVEPGEGDQGTIHRTAVQTGAWDADGIEVPSGLAGGERVVTAGVSRIHEGQVVRLLDGEATP